jgi:hypothetical protein
MWAMDRMVWTALVLATLANAALVASAAWTASQQPFSSWQLRSGSLN